MFDALPTPWGLVRAGVAPDHPNIKAVSRVFEKTAAKPGSASSGTSRSGRDIDHDELERRYHAIVYACGAQTDRHMGIPGEDLPGSRPATEFVAWYNGHPDFRDLDFDLSGERGGDHRQRQRRDGLRADARAHATRSSPRPTSPTTRSRCCATATSRDIVICGRRGPAQAAFTNPELLEMGELTEADVIVDPAEVELDEASAAVDRGRGRPDRPQQRRDPDRVLASGSRPAGRSGCDFRFLRLAGGDRGRRAGSQQIELVHNELYVADDGAIRPRPTDRRETLECGLVLRSIGYRGVPLPGVPFDERRGVIPNEGGRVLDEPDGRPVVRASTAWAGSSAGRPV